MSVPTKPPQQPTSDVKTAKFVDPELFTKAGDTDEVVGKRPDGILPRPTRLVMCHTCCVCNFVSQDEDNEIKMHVLNGMRFEAPDIMQFYYTCKKETCMQTAQRSLAWHLAYSERRFPVTNVNGDVYIDGSKKLASLLFRVERKSTGEITDGWKITYLGWSRSKSCPMVSLKRTLEKEDKVQVCDCFWSDFVGLNKPYMDELADQWPKLGPIAYPPFYPDKVKGRMDAVVQLWNAKSLGPF